MKVCHLVENGERLPIDNPPSDTPDYVSSFSSFIIYNLYFVYIFDYLSDAQINEILLVARPRITPVFYRSYKVFRTTTMTQLKNQKKLKKTKKEKKIILLLTTTQKLTNVAINCSLYIISCVLGRWGKRRRRR